MKARTTDSASESKTLFSAIRVALIRQHLARATLPFTFYYQGTRIISSLITPLQLEMEDGDTVIAFDQAAANGYQRYLEEEAAKRRELMEAIRFDEEQKQRKQEKSFRNGPEEKSSPVKASENDDNSPYITLDSDSDTLGDYQSVGFNENTAEAPTEFPWSIRLSLGPKQSETIEALPSMTVGALLIRLLEKIKRPIETQGAVYWDGKLVEKTQRLDTIRRL